MRIKFLIGIISGFIIACNSGKQNTSLVKDISFDNQGHRGSRGLMPENTIPAMIKAIDLDVTTLEMDVVISKDMKVVVSHDHYFSENITTTPEGMHLDKSNAAGLLLYNMTYDSITKYDVGLKPHPGFPQQEKLAVHKPLLAELLDSSEAYAKQKGKTIAYNIEIKSKPEYDGKRHPAIEEFVDLVINVIKEKRIEGRTIIQSFDPRGLKVLHRKYPDISTSLLIEDDDKRSLTEQLQELGFTPSVYSPHFSLVTPQLIKECHDKKMKIIPWTINDIEQIKKQREMGVDGIISDYPNLFQQL
jgi:glycerophosphoryl diester phosphodiesterase